MYSRLQPPVTVQEVSSRGSRVFPNSSTWSRVHELVFLLPVMAIQGAKPLVPPGARFLQSGRLTSFWYDSFKSIL